MSMTFMNVTIVARLTRDAEHREVQGKNGPFDATTLNVAVDRPFNAPKGQNGDVTADFFRCEATGGVAKYAQYAKKGMLVALTGVFINPNPFTNQQGEVIKESQFRIDTMVILEKRAEGQGQNQGGNQNNGGYQQNGGGYQQNNNGYQNQGGNQNNGGYQQNGGGYQQNNNGYQNQGGNQNNGGYQQNGGGYQQNNGGYQNQGGNQQNGGYQQNNGGYQNQGGNQNNGGNQQQNQGSDYMNPPEGFGPVDDNPFGLGAPAGY